MSTKIIVGNLPAGTTSDEIRLEFESTGAPILGVEPVEGRDPDKLAFTLELDIEPGTARIMADRRRDRFFKGRRLNIVVPHFGD
jgi:hypothetical protein